jgi:hypothetical protein
MADLKVKVPDALIEELKSVWQFNKRHVRPDILKRMGWHDWESFCGDLLAHGYASASESPMDFMKKVRDSKDPIFLDPRKRHKGAGHQGKHLRFEHEFERAYS